MAKTKIAKCIVLRADGLFSEASVANNGLSFLQEAVGGWIESIPATDESINAYCNEEGKFKGLPPNRIFNELWPVRSDIIVGDVVIFGPIDNEGDETDVPDTVREKILAAGGQPHVGW